MMGPFYSSHAYRSLQGAILRYRPSSILEIGAGGGWATRIMADQMAEALGFIRIAVLERTPFAGASREAIEAAIPTGIEYLDAMADLPFALARLAAEGRRFDMVFHSGASAVDFKAACPLIARPGQFLSSVASKDWPRLEADPRVSRAMEWDGDVGILELL